MNFKLDKNEIFMYLGYKNQVIDPSLEKIFDEIRSEVLRISNYKYYYEIWDLEVINGRVSLVGEDFPFIGEDINNHLINSSKCVLSICTLGQEYERQLNIYNKTDLTKGLLFDACGTQLIEEVGELIRLKVQQETGPEYFQTFAYAPGYGDYPLEVQKKFVEFLKGHKRIGLSVTKNNLMIPRKSISSVMGLQKMPYLGYEDDPCLKCKGRDKCKLREAGKKCY